MKSTSNENNIQWNQHPRKTTSNENHIQEQQTTSKKINIDPRKTTSNENKIQEKQHLKTTKLDTFRKNHEKDRTRFFPSWKINSALKI